MTKTDYHGIYIIMRANLQMPIAYVRAPCIQYTHPMLSCKRVSEFQPNCYDESDEENRPFYISIW